MAHAKSSYDIVSSIENNANLGSDLVVTYLPPPAISCVCAVPWNC